MSRDLLTQLADYGDYCEQRQGSVAIGDIDPIQMRDPRASSPASVDTAVDSARSEICETCGSDLTVFDLRRPAESPTPRPGKRRAAVLAVAAAALVLAGVVVVADRSDTSLETEPVSSATTPEPVPSPSPPDPTPPPKEAGPPPSVVDSLGYRWSRVAQDGLKFPGIQGVTVGGPGLVAVGDSGNGAAAVWTSVNGITWSRVPHDEAVFGAEFLPDTGGGEIGMESVTVGGPGLVAVGGPGWWSHGDQNAVVWTSVDGTTWSRVPDDEAIFGGTGPQRMMSVTAGGPGLVAVGYDGLFEDSEAVVWTSVDGVTWSRVPDDEAVFGGAFMMSVVVGGPGLVAVGVSDSGAVVWTSVDGITWSRVPHDESVFGGGGYMASVTAGGPGLVAVGSEESDTGGDAVVWTSVDGVTWSRVPPDNAVFGGAGEQEMLGVTTGGPGLVVVGMEGYCECAISPSPNGYVPVVWTSVDGITWSRVPHDEAVFGEANLQSVTAGGPGLVAVGPGGVIVAEPMATPQD